MKVFRAAARALLPCLALVVLGCPLPTPNKRSVGAKIVLPVSDIQPGESVAVSLKLFAPSQALPVISWSAQSGGITPTRVSNVAVYTAPSESGNFEIDAKVVVGDASYGAQSIIQVRRKPSEGEAEQAAGYMGPGRIQNRDAVSALMYADSTPLYLSPSDYDALAPLLFKLRLPSGIPGSAILHLKPSGGDALAIVMAEQQNDAAFDYYLAEARPALSPFSYWFEWRDGSDSIYLSRAGTSAELPREPDCFRVEAGPGIPSWAKGLSLYCIVPDRFYNADYSNDPESTRKDWYAAFPPGEASKPLGGDIEGMARKLEYLRTLGSDALLVDSVFGKDLKVEGRYGVSGGDSEQKLADFISRAKARGLKVLLDTAAAGANANAAQELELAQAWGKKSLGAGLRPPEKSGKDAQAFYPLLRDRLKSENPDAVLVSPFPAPGGFGWDLLDDRSAFFVPLSAFLTGAAPDGARLKEAKGDGIRFLAAIAAAQAASVQGGSLGTILAMDEPGYPRLSTRLKAAVEGERSKAEDAAWLGSYRIAVSLQMSLPGSPLALYGDETALEGGGAADSLRGYPWGREDKELIALYHDLNALRKNYSALKTGSYRALASSADGLASYLRWDAKSKLIVAVNAGKEAHTLKIDAIPAGMLTGERARVVFASNDEGHGAGGQVYSVREGKLSMSLPPRSCLILLCPVPKEIPPAVDLRPRLKRIFPADKAKDLTPDTRIIMEFSEEMEQSSILEAFRILPAVKGSFVWNGDTCTFVPDGQFESKKDYSVSLGRELRARSGGFALQEGRNFSFSVK